MAYYFDHQQEIDAEIEAELVDADRAHRACQNSPLRVKLHAKGLL
jgi:hypothetical protein